MRKLGVAGNPEYISCNAVRGQARRPPKMNIKTIT